MALHVLLVLSVLSCVQGFSLNAPKLEMTAPKVVHPPQTGEGAAATTQREQARHLWKTIATAEPNERERQVLTASKGTIPDDLAGTLYMNGLGSCKMFDRLMHPYESYGFLKAIHFEQGGRSGDTKKETVAHLQARYVDTPVRKLETLFQRPLFRGAMSFIADTSTWAGRLLNALSPTERETANVAVVHWAGKVLATGDNCQFYALDPDTLETLGVEDFGGALKGHKMLAHTHIDKARNLLVTCSLKYDIANQASILTFFEFDESGELVSKTEHTQSPTCVVHDWMITPNYYVVPTGAVDFDMSNAVDVLTGKRPAISTFVVDEQAPASLVLIPRDQGNNSGSSSAQPTVVEATMDDGRHAFGFHFGPCHEEHNEEGDEVELVMHRMVCQHYQFGEEFGFMLEEQDFDPVPWSESHGGPLLEEWRVKLDRANPTNKATIASRRLHDVPSEMPTFHPDRDGLPCRYMYSLSGVRELGCFPLNAVVKHDLLADKAAGGPMQVWPPEAAAALAEDDEESAAAWDGGSATWGEPLFVPKAAATSEDEGYLLSTHHDAAEKRTSLHIFDAEQVDKGPVAELDLGELWGWTIHSSFAPRNA